MKMAKKIKLPKKFVRDKLENIILIKEKAMR